MSSARAVSHIIVDAGVNAIMSKLDKKDAYKLIPAKTEDLRLQGFSLLGKFFVETQQIFGSQKAVENFDRLGNTIHRISVIESGIDPATAPRQLDDVVCVSPAKSGICKKFTDVFMKNCKELNVPLADLCPKFEKAFYCSNFGKILGILFDTSTLSWKLPDEKTEKTSRGNFPCDKIENYGLTVHAEPDGPVEQRQYHVPILKWIQKTPERNIGPPPKIRRPGPFIRTR
jgi:hypothetical protein